MLWSLVYFSVKARYEHFSGFGEVENYSLPSASTGKNNQLLNQPNDEINQLGNSGFFWSEAAFHYRTTLMHAVDWYQSPDVLENDQWQEYPDGVNAWSQYSIFMEPVLGLLYKWFSGGSLSLIQFLMVVLPICHALLLFPIFYLAKILSRSSIHALVSVAVFSTCSLAFSPLLSSFYVKETLSWVLFSVFLVGHFSYLHRPKKIWLWIGGVGLYLFLISWHLAQFVTIPVFLVGALCLVWGPQVKEREPNTYVLQPAVLLLVFLAAGFVPWLRERWFIVGLPALIAGLWLFLALVFSNFPVLSGTRKKRFLWLIAGLVLVYCIAVFNGRFLEDYGHVSGLAWHRIANGFQKPFDPTEIPFAVRVFWVAPFSSPRWLAIKAGLGFNGVLLLLATIWTMARSFRSETSLFERALIWCASLFLLAFIMVERLAPVFIFFGAIVVSQLGIQVEKALKGKAVRSCLLPILFVFPGFTLLYSMNGMVQLSLAALQGELKSPSNLDQEWDSARASLFQWIKENTPGPGSSVPEGFASFVGEIGVSPQLLLYTGRPVVLNSQFENKKIRSRYLEFLTALFSESENDLVKFSQKYQVDYVLVNRDWATANGRNTPKYLAGKTGQSSLNYNISRFHFFPSRFKHFQPVYENNCYRVFEFREERTEMFSEPWIGTFNRWWNLANFSSSEKTLLDSTNDRRKLQDLDNVFRYLPVKLGRISRSIEQNWKMVHPQSGPRMSLKSLQRELAETRFVVAAKSHSTGSIGNIRKLESAIKERLEEIDPKSGMTVRNELLNILNGDPVAHPGILEKILPFECSPSEYSTVGEIMVLLGEFEMAGEFFGQGGAVFPKPALTTVPDGLRPSGFQEQLWEKSILYLIAGGKKAKGRGLAGFCAAHVAPGSPRKRFFIQAGNIALETE